MTDTFDYTQPNKIVDGMPVLLTVDEIAAKQASDAAWEAAQPRVQALQQIAALEAKQTARMVRNAVVSSTNVYPAGSPFAGLTDAQALASIETQINALRATLTTG
jgi:hypothetical protein